MVTKIVIMQNMNSMMKDRTMAWCTSLSQLLLCQLLPTLLQNSQNADIEEVVPVKTEPRDPGRKQHGADLAS